MDIINVKCPSQCNTFRMDIIHRNWYVYISKMDTIISYSIFRCDSISIICSVTKSVSNTLWKIHSSYWIVHSSNIHHQSIGIHLVISVLVPQNNSPMFWKFPKTLTMITVNHDNTIWWNSSLPLIIVLVLLLLHITHLMSLTHLSLLSLL